MKLTCGIADDLLPLYLEEMCSEESKTTLEEHLRDCSACREKLARMKSCDGIPQLKKQVSEVPLAGYAKKVKRHRIRVGLFVALISVMAACLISLCFLTVYDMYRQANPSIFEVEAGVYNLTAAELETTAAEVGEYIFYTNTQRIEVSIPKDAGFDGEIILWSKASKNEPSAIGYGHVDPVNNTCVFSNLSAAWRYMVTCGGEKEMRVTVSDGRIVSFQHSLMNVLKEIAGR